MSKLTDDPKKFDLRCQERNIKYGVITREEVNELLDALPDVANKSITLGEIEDRRAKSDDPHSGN